MQWLPWKKKSTNGTKLTASPKDFPLNSHDIVAIIKDCIPMGVTKLKFGSFQLDIEFGRPANTNHESPALKVTDLEKASDEALLSDEVSLRNDQFRQMHIEDPAKAEELIANGDLEDDELLDE
jgi:hypothetical protein